jgi:hypothetical protein
LCAKNKNLQAPGGLKMKRFFALITGTVLAASISSARQTSSPPNEPSSSAAVNVSATLLKPIDAQKAKAGDPVSLTVTEAVKSGGRVVIPKGAKVVGHVIEAKPRKGDASSLIALGLDKIVSKEGTEQPITGSIASLARPQSSAPPSHAGAGESGIPSPSMGTASAAPRAGRSGGGLIGGPEGPGATDNGSGEQTRTGGDFTLRQKDGHSVISSNTHNVHLDSGTQLLLQVKMHGQ